MEAFTGLGETAQRGIKGWDKGICGGRFESISCTKGSDWRLDFPESVLLIARPRGTNR